MRVTLGWNRAQFEIRNVATIRDARDKGASGDVYENIGELGQEI